MAKPASAAEDPRLSWLLDDCSRQEFYDRNTAWMVPVLVEKLGGAPPEVLQQVKDELAALGPEAMPTIRRLAERAFSDPVGFAQVQNAVEVAALADGQEAHDLLITALDHPHTNVRMAAMRGLAAKHATPEDFPRLVAQVRVEFGVPRQLAAICVHRADPQRAAPFYLAWLAAEDERELWPHLLEQLLAGAHEDLDPEVAEEARRRYPVADPSQRASLAALAAKGGDGGALEFLREELRAGELERRAAAVEALGLVGLTRELSLTLRADPEPRLRLMAASAIAGHRAESADPPPLDRDSRADLAAGMQDPDEEVRKLCTRLLCLAGDPDATERALSLLLAPDARDLELAMQALLPRFEGEPELAARAFEALERRAAREDQLPLAERSATLRGIGLVPGAASARKLLELARDRPQEVIADMRAHQWLLIQAGNSGVEGRRVVVESLADKTDPVERLDVLWAIGAVPDDLARETLLALVEDPQSDPYERLFAADRLVRLGPSATIAPRLKRATYATEHEEVRRALRCLLWLWY